jgi:hypothetical protein
MSSLIKNLRDLAALAHADVSVADEAADEIERLRAREARLREALSLNPDDVLELAGRLWAVHPKTVQDSGLTRRQWYAREIGNLFAAARAALAEKDEKR